MLVVWLCAISVSLCVLAVDPPLNHFLTLAFSELGCSVYDDLLLIQPGGWQGTPGSAFTTRTA